LLLGSELSEVIQPTAAAWVRYERKTKSLLEGGDKGERESDIPMMD